MKRNRLIIVIAVILAIAGVAVIADYYTLENQIIRDIDEYYENGQDPDIGNQIMNKIGLMGANSEERLQSFLEKNPKVNDFLTEWVNAQV